MSEMIMWYLLLIACNQPYPLRTRTDHAHVTTEHIPELREFIKTRLAKNMANSRHPDITFLGVGVTGVAANTHGSELVEREWDAMEASP